MKWLSFLWRQPRAWVAKPRAVNPCTSSGKIVPSSRVIKRQRGKQILVTAVATCLTLTMAACASLPDSGPVREGEVNRDARNPLAQLASGPVDGSTPEKLLADFQQACAAGTYDDYGIARQFLSAAQRRSWKPQAQVTVLKPKNELKVEFNSTDNTATGTGQPILRLSKAGIEKDYHAEETFKYQLVKENDQWRINALPDGVVLTSSAFKNAYGKRNVYYWSSDRRFLIPDPRWVPRKNSPQHLLEALFSGPTADLKGALHLPEILEKVPSNLVTLQGKKAQVELPETVRLRSEADISQLYQQLRLTLLDVAGIEEVIVTQYDAVLSDPSEQPVSTPKRKMLGIRNGEVIEESDSQNGVFNSAADLSGIVTWPTPSTSDFQVAIRGGNELVRLQRGKAPVVLYRGKNLRNPQIDPWGWVWTGDSSKPGDLVAVNAHSRVVTVKVPSEGEWKIPFFALSSPGVRGLVVWQIGYSFQGQQVTVIRSEDGTPTQVVATPNKTAVLRDVLSVAWIDSGQVAILQGGSSPKVHIAAINSYDDSFEPALNARYLVPNPPDGNVQVVTDRTVRMVHIEQSWRVVGNGVSYPAFAGSG